MNTDVIVTWVGALCTLAILSVLYSENRFYRLFEHIFIGVATGYGVFIYWRDGLATNWWEPLTKGQWYWIFAPLVASLYYAVYFKKYAWMSRLLIIIMFALGAGAEFRAFSTQIFPQITSSFVPLVPGKGLGWPEAINNLIFIVTLLSVMTYFFFSFRHESKVVQKTAGLGRWLLMIAFGATFGSTVMARFSLFIDRMQFLLVDWLHLTK